MLSVVRRLRVRVFYRIIVDDVDDQVADALAIGAVDSCALVVVFAGANDLLGGQTYVSQPANSIKSSLELLIGA
ncbi:MAG TPA: hypothetical protein DHW22_01185 [Planctomycetaceae bacterium]|nr:hypothetical protein [Planctomycetaceae bacterium]